MHDVFISYSRRDKEFMQRVVNTLRQKGITVWTDEGIEPGTESWKRALSDAIKQCQCVVVIFSPDSAQSTWVLRELDFAELHRKKLYPVLLRGERADAIPFGYTTYQFVDFRGDRDFDTGIESLVESLNAYLKESRPANEPATSTEAAPNEQPLTWRWLTYGHVNLSIPSHWKYLDPTPEAIRRSQVFGLGKDETLYSRAIQEFDTDFVHTMTGLPFGSMESLCVMSDISDLAPLVGYLGEYRGPYVVPSAIMPIFVPMLLQNTLVKNLKEHYRSHVTGFDWWKVDYGQIWTYTWEFKAESADTLSMKGRTFVTFPNFSGRRLFLNINSQESRFEKEQDIYEQVAKSLRLIL